LPFFGLRPGGITPYDWPSQYAQAIQPLRTHKQHILTYNG